MAQNNLGSSTAQGGSTGSQGMSCWDRRERRRQLKRELRELGHHPGHGLFFGLLLIVIGGLFLAGNLFNFNFGLWWPLILVVIGIFILSRAFYWRD